MVDENSSAYNDKKFLECFARRKNCKSIWDFTTQEWDADTKGCHGTGLIKTEIDTMDIKTDSKNNLENIQSSYTKEELYSGATAVKDIKKFQERGLIKPKQAEAKYSSSTSLLQKESLWSQSPQNIHTTASSSTPIVKKNVIYTYLLIFHSGRTVLALYNKQLEPGTRVFIESDRGEDLARVLLTYVGMDENTRARAKTLINAEVEIYSKEQYDEKTRRFFMTNYLYTRPVRIKCVCELHNITDDHFAFSHNELYTLEYINNIKDEFIDGVEFTKCEYQWDGKRVTVYYRSSTRIDFRGFVRQLFKHLRIRIWMCSENRELYKQ